MFRMNRDAKQESGDRQRLQEPAQETPPVGRTVPQSNQAAGYAPQAESAASSSEAYGDRPSASATRAYTDHDNLARAIKDGVIGGFVGATTALTGEANFKGMLRVDGHLSGRVNSEKGTLIVSGGGKVDAEVNVAVAKINGTVNGNVNTTERLELGRTARVVGNIQTPELVIEQGAIFEGSCHMMQRSASVAAAPQPAQQSQPPQQRPAPEKSPAGVGNGKQQQASDNRLKNGAGEKGGTGVGNVTASAAAIVSSARTTSGGENSATT
ncbi:MAG: bactofilin family protein [Pyrinomonadaceae bacterium]